MDENDLQRMYTSSATTHKTTNPTAQTYLSGLKITNSHIQKIQIGESIYEIPSVTYVRLLEEQIKDLRKEIKHLYVQLNQEKNKTNSFENRISDEIFRMKNKHQ